ncbi:MAG: tRNA isopentenyl-2-thiomethyl-A-37 hydroxylase MiaE, partial [Alphaproteobacteria bacterium]
MLNLASETDPAWVERATANLDELLADHANCEKKAASTAVSLLFRYPDRADLLRPLARLAREELAHYEQVLDAISARGEPPRRLAPSPYAG